jgi:hypothetical protein
LELDFKRVRDRTNHVIHTENPGHETDHQEFEPGHGENPLPPHHYRSGLHLLPFWDIVSIDEG